MVIQIFDILVGLAFCLFLFSKVYQSKIFKIPINIYIPPECPNLAM